MKRRIAIILLLLIGGTIVNVAVAWGCAYVNARRHGSPVFERNSTGNWDVVLVYRRLGSEFVACSPRLSNDVNRQALAAHPTQPWWTQWWDELGPFGTGEWGGAHGWPAHSLSAWRGLNPLPERDELDEDYVTFGGYEIHRRDGRGMGLIPLTPIVPGFLINTNFYALLLWLLFVAPVTARRLIRRRRGLCEKCAYPIGVSSVCTECGAAVTRQRKAEA